MNAKDNKEATMGKTMMPAKTYTATGRYAQMLTERRRAAAAALGATHIAECRYELIPARLPADLRRAIADMRARAVLIGSTTYRSSCWAIVPEEVTR
jgi:hypothetical protein